MNLISPSASARAPERLLRPAILAAGRQGVGFALDDPALELALRTLVRARPEFYEAEAEDAAVVVTDQPQSERGFAARRRQLSIGGGEGSNALDSLDPTLIVAALSLLAAGYRLERDRPEAFADAPLPHLSQRERQVAALLVDGASNKLIARQLEISVHTAKFHVTAIMEKLGARNRADVVAIVLREGLVAL